MGCARLEAEVYPQERVSRFVTERFVPVRIHIKERPEDFPRFKAEWTPTLILAEADGTERYRFVGYLPPRDFLAQLELGLAKTAFSQGRYREAWQAFEILSHQYPDTETAAEALYWTAVSAYKSTSSPDYLKNGGIHLRDKFPHSDWAKKSSVWVP